jgi:phage N-6-adenine-methyltransferase
MQRTTEQATPMRNGSQGEMMSLEKDTRLTPSELFDEWNSIYEFDLDVAADDRNAKCSQYFTAENDGLAQSWSGYKVWCNPPYSEIPKWVSKAHNEIGAKVICMLIPANRTEQPFWQDLIEPYRDKGERLRTVFIPKRIRFIHPETGQMGSPMFGCVMLVWENDK